VLFFVFLLDFRTVPTVCYFLFFFYILELFRQCGILDMFRQCGILELFRQCGILELFRQCGILELFRQCGIFCFSFHSLLLLFT
jgi:hypothetical protein